MHMRARAAVRFGVLAVIAAVASPAAGGPPSATSAKDKDPKKQCVTAYEDAQALRNTGRLRAAREQDLLCSAPVCSKVLRKDCVTWAQELDASIPTVVFEVHDRDDKETSSVRVLVDDEPLLETLSGKAVEVDPGQHLFRYELAGAEPIEEHMVIREGEKNRKLSVSFFKPPPPSETPTPTPTTPQPPPSGSPVGPIVLGSVGVIGVGVFATLAILGTKRKGELESSCAPRCAHADVSSVRNELVAGDIALGVGVVSLGAAAILFFRSRDAGPAEAPAKAAWSGGLRQVPGGAMMDLSGRF